MRSHRVDARAIHPSFRLRSPWCACLSCGCDLPQANTAGCKYTLASLSAVSQRSSGHEDVENVQWYYVARPYRQTRRPGTPLAVRMPMTSPAHCPLQFTAAPPVCARAALCWPMLELSQLLQVSSQIQPSVSSFRSSHTFMLLCFTYHVFSLFDLLHCRGIPFTR